MLSLCPQPKTGRTTSHQRYLGFRVWPTASDALACGPCQEEGSKQSLWQSSREGVLGKASKGEDTLDKEHHQGFRLGWIESGQRLREGPVYLQGLGLVPS